LIVVTQFFSNTSLLTRNAYSHSPDGKPPGTFVPGTAAHSGLPFWQHHEHPMTKGEVEGLPHSAHGTTHNLHPNPTAHQHLRGAPITPEDKAAADNKAMLAASQSDEGGAEESAKEAPKEAAKAEKNTEESKPPPSINQHTAGGAPVHGANTLLLEESPGHLQIPIAGGPMNGHEGGGLHMPPTEQLEQPAHGGLPAWMAHTHPFQRGHVPGQVYNNHIHEHKKIDHINLPQNAHYPPVGSAIHAAPHMLMPLTPGRR
jgi:hypothetical protein